MTREGKLMRALALAAMALLAVAGGAAAKRGEPDLAATKLSKPPAVAAPGAKLRLSVVVANRGPAAAGKSRLGVFLARGKKHGKRDKLVKAVNVRPLPPGRKAHLKLRLRLPRSARGAYRLIACADFKRKLEETKEGDNCRASRRLVLSAKTTPPVNTPSPKPAAPPAAPPPVPQAPAAAPAFTATDDVDWGRVERIDGSYPEPGTPITTTLRAADGIPGQAGYTRSEVPASPFLTGSTTKFEFGNGDDGQVTVSLPFAFPFGGIEEHTASVSTNGWLGFGTSPAQSYWGNQDIDYRGVPGVVGDFYRGLMPYFGDLLVESGNEVREVVPADESFVAFQWEVQDLNNRKPRSLQIVLFPDGSFRFDYPGPNEAGIPNSFIGYSLGTGPASVEALAVNTAEVPSSSLAFTPEPVAAPGALPAGSATLSLPRGSSLVEAPGCTLQQAPTSLSAGSVSCPIAELGAGQQAERAVTYTVPPHAPGQGASENFKFVGDYVAGPYELADHDEVPLLYNYLTNDTLSVGVSYTSGAPTVGS
ncbi:MAG TPA: CARDB domain-containing protein, partial [Solirubrobacterales bacterium]|nr:CARDB domain-containing protein [Solirubrobacterales bacterium]